MSSQVYPGRRRLTRLMLWTGPLVTGLLLVYLLLFSKIPQRIRRFSNPENVADGTNANDGSTADETQTTVKSDLGEYREIFSLTTRDGKFLPIYWNGEGTYNPNLLPHPADNNSWVVVSQHEQTDEQVSTADEFVCIASLLDDVLVCSAQPDVLPVEASIVGQCFGAKGRFNFKSGPRDARMFYSPAGVPYLIYGSQSHFACIGIWIHDLGQLVPVFRRERDSNSIPFQYATEIQRPPPWHEVEKNFFIFWDENDEEMFAHYDLAPKRTFAKISEDGTVGPDLSIETLAHDEACIARLMPPTVPGPGLEAIHQATNTLRITLCKRGSCVPSDANTFIMHIFHHKSFYDFHGRYEPYVVLFNQSAPFALHAIAQRPLWIHGRNPLTAESKSVKFKDQKKQIPSGHTEQFYVTSISWKNHGQTYHGYIDDPLFLGFGIEDTRSGAIDVKAEDILPDLAFC